MTENPDYCAGCDAPCCKHTPPQIHLNLDPAKTAREVKDALDAYAGAVGKPMLSGFARGMDSQALAVRKSIARVQDEGLEPADRSGGAGEERQDQVSRATADVHVVDERGSSGQVVSESSQALQEPCSNVLLRGFVLGGVVVLVHQILPMLRGFVARHVRRGDSLRHGEAQRRAGHRHVVEGMSVSTPKRVSL